MYVGIDVAADRLNCVAIDASRRVVGVWLFPAAELNDLVAAVAQAEAIALDAPAQLSTMPHVDDGALPPKFQKARCAEIALGRQHGIWVPWVAPVERPNGGWIETGLRVFEALNAAPAAQVLEVFPYSGYRVLAPGERLPKKQSVPGIRARVAVLTATGVAERDLLAWSHDGLDALLGAVVALDAATGRGRRVTCGHDLSAIWLPALPGRS